MEVNMNTSRSFTIFVSLLISLVFSMSLSAQEIDYAKRELTASPAVRAKLTSMRSRIAQRKANFTVGYTDVFDKQTNQITGFKPNPNYRSLQPGTVRMMDADRAAKLEFQRRTGKVFVDAILAPSASAPFLDWRRLGIKTVVQNQGGCGSCWDFGALAAYESSYQKRNGTTPDLSEQQILDCSGAGSCSGGDHTEAFAYLISKGTVPEASLPYAYTKSAACKFTGGGGYDAVAWNYVTWEAISGTNPWPRIPTVSELKAALAEHGPLAVGLWANDAFKGYTGGVFEELHPPGSIDEDGLTVQPDGSLMGPYEGHIIYASNHIVLLLGWDDSRGAWLIKNSWGKVWGETGGYGTDRGYAWVKYNNLNVGLWGAWVTAESTALKPYLIKPALQLPAEIQKPKPIERPMVKRP
jgi:cathepsin L